MFQRYLVDQADSQLSGLLSNAQTTLHAMNGDAGAGGGYTHLAIPPGYLVEGVDQQGDPLQFGNAEPPRRITTRAVPGFVFNARARR